MKRLPTVTLEWVYDSGLRGCAPLALPLVAWGVFVTMRKVDPFSFSGSIITGILVVSVLLVTGLIVGAVRRRWWPTWREVMATGVALLVTGGLALGSLWGAAAAGAGAILLGAIGVAWVAWLLAGDLVMPAKGPARLYLWLYRDLLHGEIPIWAREDTPYAKLVDK